MSLKREITQLIREKSAAGWDVTKTKGGHYRWHHLPSGGFTFSASTPSDRRSVLNTMSELRRIERAAA